MKRTSKLLVLRFFSLWNIYDAFQFGSVASIPPQRISKGRYTSVQQFGIVKHGSYRYAGSCINSKGKNEDEKALVEPAKMYVSEIKAELDFRKVSYADCFDKESLVQLLMKTRNEDVVDDVDPSMMESMMEPFAFNKQNLEGVFSDDFIAKNMIKNMKDSDIENFAKNITPTQIEDAFSKLGGNIPGGLKPDSFKQFLGNPKVMAALSNPKMQEAMKLVTSGNHRELQKKLEQDTELCEMVEILDSLLSGK